MTVARKKEPIRVAKELLTDEREILNVFKCFYSKK